MWEVVVSGVAAVAALASAFFAGVARRDSGKAAVAARDSADAATATLNLSQHQDARATERRDVTWDRRGQDGLLEYHNVGSTTARAVTAVLTINGDRTTLDSIGDVEPGQSFTHDASDAYSKAVQEREDEHRRALAAGFFMIGSPRFDVAARITWESELGTPDVQTI